MSLWGSVAEVDFELLARRGGRLDGSDVLVLGRVKMMEGKEVVGVVREEVAGCRWAVGDKGEDLGDQALLHACVLGDERAHQQSRSSEARLGIGSRGGIVTSWV